MKLVVYTTNNYPHYSKQEITVTEANAMKEFERLSHELKQKANSGELQDYEIELNKR